MRAIVLVGGEGTRLRPLTFAAPKQMLPIVEQPMIVRVLAALAAHGIDEAVLSLGYRPDDFIAAFPDRKAAGIDITFVVEKTLLDTAGAIRYAARQAAVDETFLVVNGDVLSDIDLTAQLAFHRLRGGEATIALTPVEDPSAFGVVPTDEDGRVTAFIEKPPPETAPTNLINAGAYILEPSVVERIPDGRRVSIERETFPELVADGALYALASDAYWLDTGTPAKYVEACLDIVWGKRTGPAATMRVPLDPKGYRIAHDARCLGDVDEDSYIGSGAVIDRDAVVRGAVVEGGSHMRSDARAQDSVLLAGCVVGEETLIEDSIIGPGARIGENCMLTGGTVIGWGAEVPADTVLDGGRLPSVQGFVR